MTRPTRQDFRLTHRLRVRWAEVDLQRIVFNPHYLVYLDIAFTEYWRALAIPYEAIPELLGGDLYVKKSTLEYHGSARLDDVLDIGLKCERIGNSSIVFRGGVFKGEARLLTAELVYVFADSATQSAKTVPTILRELLQSYESGAAATEVQVGWWSELGTKASALRDAVFVRELQLPSSLAHDAADTTALHLLVLNRLGQALATARLSQEGSGVARIARVAVHRAMRSAGLGRTVLLAFIRIATERGDTRAVLRAQHSAQRFYASLGFEAIGDAFVEAGVPHIEMARMLKPL